MRRECGCLFAALILTGCIRTTSEVDASTTIDSPAMNADANDGSLDASTCSESFGSGLRPAFGRLDGRLVAIVPPDARECRGDADHLRLQLLIGGAVYDVAVTARSSMNPTMPEVFFAAVVLAPPGPPFAEGFHTDVALDYPSLGVHASDLTPLAEADLAARLEVELLDVSSISVFATGYADGDGAHLVHRNGSGFDGAIVLRPLDPISPVLVFRFADQAF